MARSEKLKVYNKLWMRKARVKNPQKYPAMNGQIKRWRKDNPEEYREQKRRWYHKHKDRERQRSKDRNALLRRMVLTHYSNGLLECACCGENIYAFLTINHINGGGVKERKQVNPALSYSLIKRGYPSGYNVLCYNCNCADAFAKGCPHKLLKLD